MLCHPTHFFVTPHASNSPYQSNGGVPQLFCLKHVPLPAALGLKEARHTLGKVLAAQQRIPVNVCVSGREEEGRKRGAVG